MFKYNYKLKADLLLYVSKELTFRGPRVVSRAEAKTNLHCPGLLKDL